MPKLDPIPTAAVIEPLDADDELGSFAVATGSESAVEQRRAVVGPGQHGQRLDKVLVHMAPEFSRNHLQSLVERGHVAVDGTPIGTASRKLRVGQVVSLELVPTEESQSFQPQAMPLAVQFEDPDLLVLDKPAGLVVHPAAGNWSGTLLNGLLAHHAGAAALPRAGIVHRLDKDTSGLMLVGKSLPAVTALTRAISAREVQRRYVALVHGVPGQSRFTVDAPIGRDPRVRVRMAVVPETSGGRVARTDFELLGSRHGVSALRCVLHTGRTHQIRVHLSACGLPLLADAVYGGRTALGLQRQALHAWQLKLLHPISAAPLQFVSEPPADLAHALEELGVGLAIDATCDGGR